MTRILIAGVQPLVRTGIRTILDQQPDLAVVGEAQNCQESVEQSRTLRPDVVLMDARMPMLDGMAAIREIAGAGADDEDHPGVLLLTTLDAQDHIYRALHAGVRGILVEDCDAEELIRAIRAVADHQTPLSP